MPTTHHPDIAETVKVCVTFCKDAPDPEAIITRFLEKLSVNPKWSAEEVAEVRRQVYDRLANGSGKR